MSQPLTFGELAVGDHFICFPTDGDDHGHGGYGPIMACHESKAGSEYACVGWLDNQLGPGNNLALRMRAIAREFDPRKLVVEGDQYDSIEEMCDAAPPCR